MKGYVIKVKTSNTKGGKYVVSKTIAPNIVFTNIAQAIGYILNIKNNKIENYGYRLLYDNLFVERNRRLHSDIDLAITSKNNKIVKKYTIKPIHIYE